MKISEKKIRKIIREILQEYSTTVATGATPSLARGEDSPETKSAKSKEARAETQYATAKADYEAALGGEPTRKEATFSYTNSETGASVTTTNDPGRIGKYLATTQYTLQGWVINTSAYMLPVFPIGGPTLRTPSPPRGALGAVNPRALKNIIQGEIDGGRYTSDRNKGARAAAAVTTLNSPVNPTTGYMWDNTDARLTQMVLNSTQSDTKNGYETYSGRPPAGATNMATDIHAIAGSFRRYEVARGERDTSTWSDWSDDKNTKKTRADSAKSDLETAISNRQREETEDQRERQFPRGGKGRGRGGSGRGQDNEVDNQDQDTAGSGTFTGGAGGGSTGRGSGRGRGRGRGKGKGRGKKDESLFRILGRETLKELKEFKKLNKRRK